MEKYKIVRTVCLFIDRPAKEWVERMKAVWSEIDRLFSTDEEYLGIDTSIAPLSAGGGSLIHLITRLGLTLSHAVTIDVFLKIARSILERSSGLSEKPPASIPC